MFQLFRSTSSSLEKGLPLSLRSLSNKSLDSIEKTCLLCKLLNINTRVHVREQSSLTQTKKKRKKYVTKSRLYADILVVCEQSSHFKKANVTKLKPEDLNLLATTDVPLNELYKIKQVNRNISKYLPLTYSNLIIEGLPNIESENEVVEGLPNIESENEEPQNRNLVSPQNRNVVSPQTKHDTNIEDIEEACLVENDLDLQTESVADSFHPEILEEITETETSHGREEVAKESDVVRHFQHRNAIAAKTLSSYVEVCNHLRNPQRGLFAFNFHQYKAKSLGLSTMKDINVYYALLKGFANKGDYPKVQHILSIMEAEKIEPDLNCYVAIFECLGKSNCQNNLLKQIRIHTKEAFSKGITFGQMMNKGIFLNDERRLVLNAMQAFDKKYVPKYEKPIVFYNNHLVDQLNNTISKEEEPKYRAQFIETSVMEGLVKTQLALEQNGYVTIKSIEKRDAPTKEVLQYREALNQLYQEWYVAAQNAFERDLATLKAKRSPFNMEPYLRSIPSKEFVEIIVQEAIKMAQGSETYSPEVFFLYKMLGSKVYTRYKVLRKQKTGVLDKALAIHLKYCQNYARLHTELDTVPEKENFINPRIEWQNLEHELIGTGATLQMGHQPWVPSNLNAIGKFLYHIIMHDLMVNVNCISKKKNKNFLPAFYSIFRSQGRLIKEEVKPHPVLFKLYKLSQPETLTFPAHEVPMMCPPVPWTSVNNGGYVISPSDLVRLPFQAGCQKKRMVECDPEQMYPNFDALNQLSEVPWKVNTKILDVLLEVFRNGGSSKLDVPEPPSSLPPLPTITHSMDKSEKYQLFKQKLQLRRKKAEMYSLWCDCLYRLSLANHFRDDVFWLPHNMDFRGRVYPVPPHLNHLGSDLARSMLIFAEPRPLGPHGLDWLKVHLINLTGLKKRDSVQDRLNFANDIMNLILDSADNPLTGQKWWAQSDEPWQTLACCMEIADVIRSGMNPADYKSHFPIHQDGSCNGLQHYAALGRDSAGAFSVNLTSSDVPQDVYSAVVQLVEQKRAEDEADGIEIAKLLNGFVKRKVIKQTIMTTVYGVTRFGARLQIAKQLKDIDDFPKEAVWAASNYLTACTFESLRTMFKSTREIQDWFTECARLISGVGGSLVEWVTPLGLPVVQPYTKFKKPSMPAEYEGFCMDQYERPNVMKQKNAFPPNFIHSLDSCHMMLTSLHCQRAGITFVSVHDCYWTHPSTTHIMNKICREQFVALHSEPILENLSVFLYDLFAYDESNLTPDASLATLSKKKLNRVLKQLPKKGDFDINNVVNSVYFFS